MGNDGGSIPSMKVNLCLTNRKVRSRQGEDKRDQSRQWNHWEGKVLSFFLIKSFRATLCSLTKQPLKKPVVADRLGYFFNKEVLLRHLIDKDLPKHFEHISNMKDVVDVNVESNPKPKAEFPFVCPVSSNEYNGLNKFVLVWGCGCMVSEKAMQETKDIVKGKCIACGNPYKPGDIISLNLTQAEQEKIKKEILDKKEEKVFSNV